jgi:hypothetical protein
VRLIREYAAKLVSATFCRSQSAAETGNWLLQKLALVRIENFGMLQRENKKSWPRVLVKSPTDDGLNPLGTEEVNKPLLKS